MPSRQLALWTGIAGLLSLLSSSPTHAADGPTLLKRTVAIKLHRYGRYWPNPAAKEPTYNTYCWVPEVRFEVLGPIPGGSQFSAEFLKPTGTPWITVKIPTQEVGDDDSLELKTPQADDGLEKKAITSIGTFPFRIRLKNELTGKNQIFYSGKYEVTKFPLPRVPAGEKNKMDFATVEDWRAPIGYLWLNPADRNENVPPVATQMWFRGASSGTDMQAILFKDGVQLDSSRGNVPEEIPTPGSENAFNWYLWQFSFPKVRGFNKDESANSWTGVHFLDKNPGNYEIRVLRAGKLARILYFAVGEDGKIENNGVASANKMGGIRQVVFVKVVGNADGTLKPNAWKTHALYGNPLAGLVPFVPTTAPEPRPITKVSAEPAAAPAANLPTLLKSTLLIRADRMVRYWKSPNTDNYWSWVPQGRFMVVGPIATGTKFVVDFTKPDGSPWTSVDCLVEAAGPNEVRAVAIAGSSGHMDKRAILDTGTFGFKIRMVNEATGVKAPIFSGKFTVGKFHKGNALPAFKNQFEYYVDYDWALPIGYLWLNWLKDPQAPALHANLWMKRSDTDSSKVAAYVFYNGKQIASSKDQTASVNTIDYVLTSGSDTTDPTYHLWDFTFNSVRGWNTDTSGNRYDAHFLATNPGEYEIKVLAEGGLVRSAKFTVGADGKIVDNGIATANRLGGIAYVLPVKVQGSADQKWDAAAWKTEAFFNNPLKGFTAP